MDEPHCFTCPITSKEQQDAVIDATIRAAYLDPQAPTSLRAIASMLPQWLKADHKRVGRRLSTLVSTGALPQLSKTQGKDGKYRRPRQLPKADIPDDFTPQIKFICGEALSELRCLPNESAHCCVTSPPFYQQMDVSADEQIGQEESVEEYIGRLIKVFDEVQRTLRPDGTCWINIADTYRHGQALLVPQRLALALQSQEWRIRAEIVIEKNNSAPYRHEGRPTPTHETLFLLSLSVPHYFDDEALRQEYSQSTADRPRLLEANGTLRGSVWRMPISRQFAGHHPAPMSLQLATDCVLAGCPPTGTVIDPFAGVGTSLIAAAENYRHATGIELSPYYLALARQRLPQVACI